ncbi:Protein ABHD13 [Hondaea fermentalgiana]|uniref:Protein ABHD13 n=1 Tax=Hondaea fermentalgiana TaxID=2315210 RepID=A0A2R5G2X9_9STRA|nr:Protein ABHD13 [Hondaea fermentalgiana]|eukprot:GBG25387.1 Protein ABHD13 [Hondaea fermentalgiana]
MLSEMLQEYGMEDVTVGRAVVGTLLLHIVWLRHNSLLPDLARNAGRLALVVARLVMVILMLENLVSLLVLPAQVIHSTETADGLAMKGWDILNVSVPVSRGPAIHVSAGVFTPAEEPGHKGLTIILLPPNGASFEEFADFMIAYAKDAGAERVVGINYRGVGQSEGGATCAKDLVDDAEAVIEYLIKERGYDEKLMLVHGWSLGGAVALQLRQKRPHLLVVSDRSFRSLSAAAISMLEEPIPSGAVGLFAGFVAAFVLCGDSLKQFRFVSKWGGAALAIVFAIGGLKMLVPDALHLLKWEFDIQAPEVLYSSPLIVLFHREDGIIAFDDVSLHQSLDLNQPMVIPIEMEHVIVDNPAGSHMYVANSIESEWSLLIKAIHENLPKA